MSDDSPYGGNQAAPESKPPPIGHLELMRSYQFVMESENWLMNLVMGSLCMLAGSVVPLVGQIVGQLVFDGYRFEIIEALHRNGGRQRGYPDFDMNKILDYLVRGVWPFLVSLIFSILIVLPMLAVLAFGVFLMVLAAQAGPNEDITVVAIVVIVIVALAALMLLSILASIIIIPFWLRAGLSQDIGLALDFRWAMDFIGHMWRDIIVSMLFLALTGMFASMAGALLCGVGVLPAAAWVGLAQAHVVHQLYEIYLTRGGEPIPLRDSTVRVF